MSLAETPHLAACPACVAAPAAEDLARGRRRRRVRDRSRSRCRASTAPPASPLSSAASPGTPGVRNARVNLTLKRVSIETEPGTKVDDLITRIEGLGYEAHELDSAVLASTEIDRKGRDLLMRLARRLLRQHERHAPFRRRLVGGGGRDARHVPLAVGHDRHPDDRLRGAPVLRKRVVRAPRPAAQHGRADLARHDPRRHLLDLGDGVVRRTRLFRRRDHADLLPPPRPLPRLPHARCGPLRRAGTDGARGAEGMEGRGRRRDAGARVRDRAAATSSASAPAGACPWTASCWRERARSTARS